eukprot:6483670-Amphidinium_carterae.1
MLNLNKNSKVCIVRAPLPIALYGGEVAKNHIRRLRTCNRKPVGAFGKCNKEVDFIVKGAPQLDSLL